MTAVTSTPPAPPTDASVDVFARWLLAELHAGNVDAVASDRLVEDLGLDSLQVYACTVVVERAARLTAPPSSPPVLATIADAFAYYQLCSNREVPVPPSQEVPS